MKKQQLYFERRISIKTNRLSLPILFLRLSAIVLAASVLMSLVPFFRVGHRSDIVFQVPVNAASEELEFSSLDLNIDDFSSRSADGDAYLISSLTASPDMYSSVDRLVEKNTFVITESVTDNGIPEELLALSEFVLDNSIVYVSVSELNVRSFPSADAEIIATLHYSDHVMQVGIGSSWSRIQMDDLSEGYIVSSFLSSEFIATPTPTPSPTPTPTPKPAVTESAFSGKFYAVGTVNVRSGPGTEYQLIKSLSSGDAIDVIAKTSNGWYRTVKDTYVLSSLVSSQSPVSAPQVPPTVEPDPNNTDPVAPPPSPTAAPVVTPADPSTSDIATYAKSFIGVPYVYTGMSVSGFDCSGYVSYVYANYYNYSLPHQSARIAALGSPVSSDSMVAGDVICYDYSGDGVVDHVGLYIGDGMLVHASSNNKKVVLTNFSMNAVTSIRRFI